MTAVVLFLFIRFLPEGVTISRTVAFTTIVMLEMVRVSMIRSRYGLAFFSNIYLILAILLSISELVHPNNVITMTAVRAGIVFIIFIFLMFNIFYL